MNATDVNLYLVGFMGTGKSTVGRAVAHKLGFHMVDSDHEIERQQKKTIFFFAIKSNQINSIFSRISK